MPLLLLNAEAAADFFPMLFIPPSPAVVGRMTGGRLLDDVEVDGRRTARGEEGTGEVDCSMTTTSSGSLGQFRR